MPFSTSDGVRLWTATSGTATSAAPVVILHGGPGLWDDYAVLAEMIDDLTVVHRFDQRGCGRSDPSEVQTMARLAQDIDELRAYFGHERIVVLGHSFGASLALLYAATYADHAAGLVYLDGVGIGDWHAAAQAEAERRMTPDQRARLEGLSGRKRTPAEETEFRTLSWFTDHADRDRAMEWAHRSASVDLPINFAANSALSADMRSWPDDYALGLAASLECPVTFIHGEGDPRPASAVRALAGDHAFELIPAAGHSPWLEQPELFRGLLRRIVSGEEGA
ncbi:alpha/beta fold hydrolase [Kribbella jiaozuonensis]|uniref:Alpha/beta hydrolase n=1 Tax=Kribbella jiaozuonensis TaxID=2575441 RepID=A0A4U3M3Y9_9ACTN|nr:alpha/beta hydrolase [Kribbella jiaozuonensis]TKK82574.1 alpha/beta hydrolase [Kribbella jiaozuonensis]